MGQPMGPALAGVVNGLDQWQSEACDRASHFAADEVSVNKIGSESIGQLTQSANL